jgi:hypothetical protein
VREEDEGAACQAEEDWDLAELVEVGTERETAAGRVGAAAAGGAVGVEDWKVGEMAVAVEVGWEEDLWVFPPELWEAEEATEKGAEAREKAAGEMVDWEEGTVHQVGKGGLAREEAGLRAGGKGTAEAEVAEEEEVVGTRTARPRWIQLTTVSL